MSINNDSIDLNENEISEEDLDGVAGGYKRSVKVNYENKYIFKLECAKCGHKELMVLEKQEVKPWICTNCKTFNVSKMKDGNTNYCYTYVSDEYQRLLKNNSNML